jgi:hypothetical protein
MGSQAAPQPRLPGLPARTDFAYLAALLDRGGLTAAHSIGIKIVGDEPLTAWLRSRFGGRCTGRTWWLTRQADLLVVIVNVVPHMKVRREQAQAMGELLHHARARARYHGDAEWRAERERLRSAVSASGGSRAGRRPGSPQP